MAEIENRLQRLSSAALWDFNWMADYVWKSPKLLEVIWKEEVRKAVEYHEDEPEMLAIRLSLELKKIGAGFSFLLTVSSLLQVVSLLENHLFLLAKAIEPISTTSFQEIRRKSGFWRILEFFRRVGIDPYEFRDWEQVQFLIKLRNCLIHGSGALDYCKGSTEIERAIKQKRFWPSRIRRKKKEQSEDAVKIVVHPLLGRRIQVTNSYVHFAVSLCRDFYRFVVDRVVDFSSNVNAHQ